MHLLIFKAWLSGSCGQSVWNLGPSKNKQQCIQIVSNLKTMLVRQGRYLVGSLNLFKDKPCKERP